MEYLESLIKSWIFLILTSKELIVSVETLGQNPKYMTQKNTA